MLKDKIIKQLKKDVGGYDKLMIEVSYTLGGMNYFSGSVNKRGYKLFLTPASVNAGITSTTLLGGADESGYYVFLEEVNRKSQKRLDYWKKKIEPLLDTIVDLYSEKNHAQVYELIESIK